MDGWMLYKSAERWKKSKKGEMKRKATSSFLRVFMCTCYIFSDVKESNFPSLLLFFTKSYQIQPSYRILHHLLLLRHSFAQISMTKQKKKKKCENFELEGERKDTLHSLLFSPSSIVSWSKLSAFMLFSFFILDFFSLFVFLLSWVLNFFSLIFFLLLRQ